MLKYTKEASSGWFRVSDIEMKCGSTESRYHLGIAASCDKQHVAKTAAPGA